MVGEVGDGGKFDNVVGDFDGTINDIVVLGIICVTAAGKDGVTLIK
ncbi:hypothetical protein AGMMS49936_11560 [Endomicrobiia bacterium]|nr:hypothetical protein AGMMS49936_11560 [Endomicrobiia bacterium]